MTDWINILLTAIYVLATLFIVVSNKRMADATRSQVDHLQEQFQAQNRPYICVRLEAVRGGLVCFSVENLGTTPATNVMLTANEEFVDHIPSDEMRNGFRQFTSTPIYLSPKQKLYCCIGGPSDFSSLADQTLLVDVTYDGGSASYRETVEINVDGYSRALIYDSPLGDISTYMKDLSESVERMEKRLR